MNVTDPITSAHLGFGEPTGNRREAVTTVRLTHASGQIPGRQTKKREYPGVLSVRRGHRSTLIHGDVS